MRVGGIAGAASELLVAEGLDEDRVLQRACINLYPASALFSLNPIHLLPPTFTACIQRPHVENIHTLHLSEDLQSLKTSCLLKVGRNGTGLGAWWEKVVFGFDACEDSPPKSAIVLPIAAQWYSLTIKRLQQLAVLANLWVGLHLPCVLQSVCAAVFLFREALDGRTSSDGGGE